MCCAPRQSTTDLAAVRLRPQSPAGGISELRCQALPPWKSVGSILPASPGSGGHSWHSWVGSRVPPASASVISWPSPWSLRPQFRLLVGTPLMGSGPPPVTSIACRDPISKQGHVHGCPMGVQFFQDGPRCILRDVGQPWDGGWASRRS